MSAPSARSTVKRNASRAEYDRATLMAVLAAHHVCHVAYVVDGEPRQIPTLYFCDADYLYLHGNRQSAMLRHMAEGGEVCVTVTFTDGVVVARSGFHCSMNYRSVTVFGQGELLSGEAHLAALDGFVRALVPGHEQAVRDHTPQEIAATTSVRIPLTEMSGKIRTGGPIDDEKDLDGDTWAGVIPLTTVRHAALPAEDLKGGIGVPDYIDNYSPKG